MAIDVTAKSFKSHQQPLIKRAGGYFTICYGRETIRNSILTILLTRLGERVCMPEFGSRLYELVFEPADDIFRTMANLYVFEAIRSWEPRVEVVSVETVFPRNSNMAQLTMTYRIRSGNSVVQNLNLNIDRDAGNIVVL